MSHTLQMIRTEAELDAIRGEWDELWADSDGAYYLSFASCRLSWVVVHAPQGRHLRCAILRGDDGRLAAILPMTCYRRGVWRWARTLGPEAAEGCDLLLRRGAASERGVALFAFFVREARPDLVDLPHVARGSALETAVQSHPAFRATAQADQIPLCRLAGEEAWHAYETSLSGSYRQQNRRKHRRLDETGALDFAVIEGCADSSIDWLLDEKVKWAAKADKHGPWLFDPRYRTFLKAFAAESRDVLTFVLTRDGVPAAVKVVAAGPRLCMLIIGSYDETLSSYSPGSILDAFWIRHVFEHRRDPDGRPVDIHFGAGIERYKLHWSRGHTVAAATYKVATSRWGEFPYRVKLAYKRMKRRAMAAHSSDALRGA